MENLRDAIYWIVHQYQPMTVRQVFYQGVSRGLWPKTEAEYKNTVDRLLVDMRRSGEMPYRWVADGTRWMRKPKSFDSVEEALATTAATYRRALWTDQPHYVEVWLEKEALAGVIVGVTAPWDVPLMVTRGYPSLSFLFDAAETIREAVYSTGKRVTILYLGDHDPSGDDIARNVRDNLIELSRSPIAFVRVAVTAAQIRQYDLPTRPTKQTDTRAKSWTAGDSVEVDAIEPDELRMLVENEINALVDADALDRLQMVEHEEHEGLFRLFDRHPGTGP